jgi:hypothetical protein
MPRHAATLAVVASTLLLRASAQGVTNTYTSGTPLASKHFDYPNGMVSFLCQQTPYFLQNGLRMFRADGQEMRMRR